MTRIYKKAPPLLPIVDYDLNDHWLHRNRKAGELIFLRDHEHPFAPASDSPPDFYPHNAALLGFKILANDPEQLSLKTPNLMVKLGLDHDGEVVHSPFYYTHPRLQCSNCTESGMMCVQFEWFRESPGNNELGGLPVSSACYNCRGMNKLQCSARDKLLLEGNSPAIQPWWTSKAGKGLVYSYRKTLLAQLDADKVITCSPQAYAYQIRITGSAGKGVTNRRARRRHPTNDSDELEAIISPSIDSDVESEVSEDRQSDGRSDNLSRESQNDPMVVSKTFKYRLGAIKRSLGGLDTLFDRELQSTCDRHVTELDDVREALRREKDENVRLKHDHENDILAQKSVIEELQKRLSVLQKTSQDPGRVMIGASSHTRVDIEVVEAPTGNLERRIDRVVRAHLENPDVALKERLFIEFEADLNAGKKRLGQKRKAED